MAALSPFAPKPGGGVNSLELFGSVDHGEERADSDIDVLLARSSHVEDIALSR